MQDLLIRIASSKIFIYLYLCNITQISILIRFWFLLLNIFCCIIFDSLENSQTFMILLKFKISRYCLSVKLLTLKRSKENIQNIPLHGQRWLHDVRNWQSIGSFTISTYIFLKNLMIKLTLETMVFCYQNCSDLLWEKKWYR